MPRTSWIPRPRPTLCASLRSAVKMHLHMSQEPFCARIKTGGRLYASLRSRNALQHCTRYFARKLTGKMPQTKTADLTLPEPAQSKCTWTFHKSHFVREINLQVKCRGPKPWPTLCASLRSLIMAASSYKIEDND